MQWISLAQLRFFHTASAMETQVFKGTDPVSWGLEVFGALAEDGKDFNVHSPHFWNSSVVLGLA